MLRSTKFLVAAMLSLGATLGYAAANGKLNLPERTKLATAKSSLSAPVIAPAFPSGNCCGGIGTSTELAAIYAHNANVSEAAQKDGKKPNIFIIWGDDIGQSNISAYSMGLMGYQDAQHRPRRQRRHDLHRLLRRAELHRRPGLVHHRPARPAHRPDQGRHARRHARPAEGRPDDRRACSKPHGYATGQFGKNHLGDRNEFLPTVHGFDEFYGNLYHLNAEEEPELRDYPKDPAFRKKYGPRGVLDCKATTRTTRPSTRGSARSASRRSRTPAR